MTADERLRAAATRLREVAGAATPGPWEVIGGGEYLQGPGILVGGGVGSTTATNAACIAMMHPPVALALAGWLDDLAAGWPWDDDGTCVWDDGTPMRLEESPDTHALAVADAVLGGEQR